MGIENQKSPEIQAEQIILRRNAMQNNAKKLIALLLAAVITLTPFSWSPLPAVAQSVNVSGMEFVPVTNIEGVHETVTAGVPLVLKGTVAPSNATNQAIVWSVADAGTTGATIDGTTLNTTAAGEVTVTATITGGMGGVVSISTGMYHTVAVKADGTLWAWGNNDFGQLGIDEDLNDKCFYNESESLYCPAPVQVGSENSWKTVAAGANHTVALKADGSLWAWGLNDEWQLGIGEDPGGKCSYYEDSSMYCPTPIRVGRDYNWKTVVVGYQHTVALKNDNSLWAWGRNDSGQLGFEYRNQKDCYYNYDEGYHYYYSDAGSYYFYWDEDDVYWELDGVIGDFPYYNEEGGFYYREPVVSSYCRTPVQVGAENDWKTVVVGVYHTVALKNDGSLWTWGDNYYGQLGNGTVEDGYTPTMVNSDLGWMSVAAGSSHTVALKADGSLWTWGDNYFGQLGNSKDEYSYTPIKVDFGNEWKAVVAGDIHTTAVKADGTMWAWGDDGYGQLGIGENTNECITDEYGMYCPTPVQVPFDDLAFVSTGSTSYHVAAVKADGSLWMWGANWDGQLGDGSRSDDGSDLPIMIIPPTDYIQPFTIVVERAYIFGDVNGDGEVNEEDATTLARWLAGWDVDIDEAVANVNREDDDEVNLGDLMVLRRHINGWSGYETFDDIQPLVSPVQIGFSNAPFGAQSPGDNQNANPVVNDVTLVGSAPSASLKKNGSKNDLTIIVTETFSDGSSRTITSTISVGNNATGLYRVGAYTVYMDIKGNNQIRRCYIVK